MAKSRQLRKFEWVAGAPRAVDVNTRPAAGCGLELTSLDYEVNKDRARSLTIGLEAFGPETELLRILLAVSEETFASAPELELAAEHSESYPRWLARAGLWK